LQVRFRAGNMYTTDSVGETRVLRHETEVDRLRVSREAIQFHSAIGFTDEHDIGLFYRRALALAAGGGGPAAARKTLVSERGHFGD